MPILRLLFPHALAGEEEQRDDDAAILRAASDKEKELVEREKKNLPLRVRSCSFCRVSEQLDSCANEVWLHLPNLRRDEYWGCPTLGRQPRN